MEGGYLMSMERERSECTTFTRHPLTQHRHNLWIVSGGALPHNHCGPLSVCVLRASM